MAAEEILIPDIGNFDSVDVIDILMNIGDAINPDDPLLTVESDKASMDIPAPFSGTVKEIKVKVGDTVKEGSLVAVIEKTQKEPKEVKEKPATKNEVKEVLRRLCQSRQDQFQSHLPKYNQLAGRFQLERARW